MSKHTPGPFEICKDDFDDTYYIRKQGAEKGDGFVVERIVAERIGKKADASLFASAPALLEVCEKILAKLDHPTASVNAFDAEDIRSAIAKARGEK